MGNLGGEVILLMFVVIDDINSAAATQQRQQSTRQHCEQAFLARAHLRMTVKTVSIIECVRYTYYFITVDHTSYSYLQN